MEKTELKKRKFYADPKEIEKIKKQKNSQIFQIVLGVFALILFFVFSNLQKENWYNESENEMYGVLKIGCIGIGLLEVVLSPIVLYELSITESKLSQTYISLNEEGVEGLHFNNISKNNVGQHFEISYSDIIEAQIVSDTVASKGNNIVISTACEKYSCFAIEQRAIVVKLLNERKKEQDRALKNRDSFTQSGKCYCMYCGAELPLNAKFCLQCGKNQKPEST